MKIAKIYEVEADSGYKYSSRALLVLNYQVQHLLTILLLSTLFLFSITLCPESFLYLHALNVKMAFTKLAALAAVFIVTIQTASAGCFGCDKGSDQLEWGFARDDAAYHSQRACMGYDGQQGYFQGWFGPGEEKRLCLNGPGGIRLDFTIKNENYNSGFDLGDTDCRDRLHNEIYGCGCGGRSTVSGWTFT